MWKAPSHDTFKLIAEQSPFGIAFFDSKTQEMHWCNEKFKDLTRIRPLLKTQDHRIFYSDFFPDEHSATASRLYEIAQKTGHAYDFERPMRRGKQNFPAELVLTQLPGSEGHDALISLQITDQSVNQLYYKLEEKKRDIDRILSSIEEGLLVIKKDLTIGDVASQAAQVLLRFNALSGRSFLELMFPYIEKTQFLKEFERLKTFLVNAFLSKSRQEFDALDEKEEFEIRFPIDDQCVNFRVYRLHFTPLTREDGGVEDLVCLVIDDTKAFELQAQLALANQELQKLATVDPLTQTYNRRMFDEILGKEWRRSLREKTPMALIICDVDHFKTYNDHYGHRAGDECLKAVARCMQNSVRRASDSVCRYGGEEFVVILPNTNNEGAKIVAEIMRVNLAALRLPHAASQTAHYVTMSLGTASNFELPIHDPKELLEAADQNLYKAKQSGRNRVGS